MTDDAQRGLGYRPALDGLRAGAVLLVLLEHAALSKHFARVGTAGVIVFFVLSGYLITRLLVAERLDAGRVKLRNFYARRFLRLLPALLAMLTVFGVVSLFEPKLSIPILWPLLYVSNIVQAAGHSAGVLGHTWSLSTEEQFYLLWPAALLWAIASGDRRRALWLAIAGMAVSYAVTLLLIVRDAIGVNWIRISEAPDTMAMYLLLGCAVALAESRWQRLASRSVVAVSAVVMVIAVPIGLSDGTAAFWLVGLPVVAVAAALLVVAAADSSLPKPLEALLVMAPVRGIGRISYGLYLWHAPVYALVGIELASLPDRLTTPLAVVLSFAVAALSYVVVERPALDLKARFPAAERGQLTSSLGAEADGRRGQHDGTHGR